ncbi:MAG: hypothetical protein IJM17_09260 [Firmicutes bacterium]|nr:hypothetical protein [Bacillota bacterium]
MDGIKNFFSDITGMGALSEELQKEMSESLGHVNTAADSVDAAAKSASELLESFQGRIDHIISFAKSLSVLVVVQFIVILIMLAVLISLYSAVRRMEKNLRD